MESCHAAARSGSNRGGTPIPSHLPALVRIRGLAGVRDDNALLEDREPAIDLHEGLAMTVPGIIAHQSSLQEGQQLVVPSFDPS